MLIQFPFVLSALETPGISSASKSHTCIIQLHLSQNYCVSAACHNTFHVHRYIQSNEKQLIAEMQITVIVAQ